MSLGTKLIQFRKEKKLSQVEVSERLDIKQPTYQSWEADQTQPNYDSIAKLATIFEKKIGDFYDSEQIKVNNHQEHNNTFEVNVINEEVTRKLIEALEKLLVTKEKEIERECHISALQAQEIQKLKQEIERLQKNGESGN
ncbi:MAG: helix-turn-helix transcriptional regulator [Verrucomicrobia bacterium]|nr:helix-turn-helix transcriptional regulator [Cytophagales bacterium]